MSGDSPTRMERVKGMNKKTEELEEIIGYHFKNKHYLTQALTHSSYANEKKLGKLDVTRDWSFWEMLFWS